MADVILPARIELEVNLYNVHKQYFKEQKSSPVELFGEKYMLKEFVVRDPSCVDIRKVVIKLERFTENDG